MLALHINVQLFVQSPVCGIELENYVYMFRILFCGLAVAVVCFLTSEARPTNNAKAGMSEFDIYREEGSYKHQHPRPLRPPLGKQDIILSDESDREKQDYNTHHQRPPVGIHKTMLSDESDRDKRDYNIQQRPPPMGNRNKITLSDENDCEKQDYNPHHQRGATRQH